LYYVLKKEFCKSFLSKYFLTLNLRYILLFFVLDLSSKLFVKVFFENDGKTKSGPFHHFQLRKSSYTLKCDEEIHGMVEIPESVPVLEDEVKVGLHCFSLWAPDNKYYRAVVTEVQNKKKRKGLIYFSFFSFMKNSLIT